MNNLPKVMQFEVKEIYFCSIMVLSPKTLLLPHTSLALPSEAGHGVCYKEGKGGVFIHYSWRQKTT